MASGPAKRMTVRALVVSGVITIVVGVVLAIAVAPLLGLIAAVGIVDFVLAWAFATGRLTPPGARVEDRLAPGDASLDRSYNPYARED